MKLSKKTGATAGQMKSLAAIAEEDGQEEILTFKVGDVFCHRDSNCVPQYHGDNAKAWIFKPNSERTITVEPLGKSNEFVLPKNMNDTTIQESAKSTPMSEDSFLVVLYLLIVNPELGKEFLNYELFKDKLYIFHIKLNSGKAVSVSVYWYDDEWSVLADDWVKSGRWRAGYVPLSLAAS